MPQSEVYSRCLICGDQLGAWSWIHWERGEGLHVRSSVEEEVCIIHQECAILIVTAIKDPKKASTILELLR